ncbi:MAG: polysaccharide biosynthesis protein, partial [Paludibacteraceae bacterium]|nr:polysaccharide biosynthesis protein [Paludibacteraceae bacterium]
MGVIIRQSIKGTVVNYVGVVVGFFTTFFVATRFLTAEEIGLTRVLLDAAMLFSSLALLGTGTSIVRFYPYFKDEEHEDHGFFFWSLVVPLLGFVVFSVLFWSLRDLMAEAFSEKSDLFVTYYKCIFPLAFSLLYMSVSEANANVLMRIVVPKFVREVGVRVLTLIVYFLYAFSVLDLDGFVYAFCGVYAVALVLDVCYLFSLKHISLKPYFCYITPKHR